VSFFALRGKKRHTIKIKYHAAAGESAVSELARVIERWWPATKQAPADMDADDRREVSILLNLDPAKAIESNIDSYPFSPE